MTVKKFFNGFFNRFELYLGSVASGAMFVVLLLQVISRYVFNRAFSWSEELALILFVWSIYFGATAAVLTNQHLRLEIILAKLKPKARLAMDLLGNLFFGLFSCIILSGLVPIVLRLHRNGTATSVLEIPKWINYGVLPFMFCLMIVRLVQDSVNKINKYRFPPSPADGTGAGA